MRLPLPSLRAITIFFAAVLAVIQVLPGAGSACGPPDAPAAVSAAITVTPMPTSRSLIGLT